MILFLTASAWGFGSGPYFLAWGYVEYKEPLTDKQIKDYELTE